MKLYPITRSAYRAIPKDYKGTIGEDSPTGWPKGTRCAFAAFVPGCEKDGGTTLVPVQLVPDKKGGS